MRRTVYVSGGALAGLLVGLVAATVVGKAMLLAGLQDSTSQLSLSTAFGLLAFWGCILAGGVAGYRFGAPQPDPEELGKARSYFEWLGRHQSSQRPQGRP